MKTPVFVFVAIAATVLLEMDRQLIVRLALPSQELYLAMVGGGASVIAVDDNSLAYQQSGGFFNDIPDREWKRMQQRHASMFPNHLDDDTSSVKRNDANVWYQENFEPEIACRHEQRIGGKGVGGKWVCDPHRIRREECLVYSSNTISTGFVREIQESMPLCEIHVFGNNNRTKLDDETRVVVNNNYAEHQWSISTEAAAERQPHLFKTLEQTVQELGHKERTVDLFQMEGCEWEDSVVEVKQLLILMHDAPTKEMFYSLHDRGYAIFHKEANIANKMGGKFVEYSFLKLDPAFFGNDLYATSTAASAIEIPDNNKLATPPANNNFSLALQQSGGFFDDIPEQEWKLMQQRHAKIFPNHIGNVGHRRNSPPDWYQNNFEPELTCRHEQRIGGKGDGGKWICDPHRIQEKEKCLVYSIGCFGIVGFEKQVKELMPHCEIHVFDVKDSRRGVGAYEPLVKPYAEFHHWGIHTASMAADQPDRFKTLEQTVKELGHEGRTIDLFKIDCEGCEWDTFKDFFTSSVEMKQILIELHKAPGPQARDLFYTLHDEGYAIFHKEANIMDAGKCIEYSFLKVDPEFFGNDLYSKKKKKK